MISHLEDPDKGIPPMRVDLPMATMLILLRYFFTEKSSTEYLSDLYQNEWIEGFKFETDDPATKLFIDSTLEEKLGKMVYREA